jgi:hypothetical protein
MINDARLLLVASGRGLLTTLALSLALVGAPGCAVNRPTQTPAQLEQLYARYLAAARADTQSANSKMIERIRAEEDDYLARVSAGEPAPRPTFDILIISGGGDFGAFGAGVLKGWGACASDDLRRPTFDMVTGVSTGSLIAPFAYLGDDQSYKQLLKLYTAPKDDWFALRGLLFFLPNNESFLRNDGLKRDLMAQFSPDLIARIAHDDRRQRRVLAVNATNLDVGAPHPFDIGEQAQRTTEAFSDDDPANDRDAHERFVKIFLASTAIPAVFPPVVINGSLYADGGVTSNILYGSNWRSARAPFKQWMAKYPGEPLPTIRFWVIVNNQLDIGPQLVQPQWMEIVKASMATSIRASTATALRHLATQCSLLSEKDGWDVQFRYIAIPKDWRPPNSEQFNADVMRSLADLGMQLGADPASWRSDFSSN